MVSTLTAARRPADGDPATTPSASCATSRRSRSSRRSPTASPTTSGRCGRAGSPTSSSGSRPGSAPSRSCVLKGGYPAWAPLGEGNATVERAEPTRYRPDWGGRPAAARPARRDVRGAAGGSRRLARAVGRGPEVAADRSDPRAHPRRPVAEPRDGRRSRSTRRTGAVTLDGRAAGDRAGRRGPAQPALLPALRAARVRPRCRRP